MRILIFAVLAGMVTIAAPLSAQDAASPAPAQTDNPVLRIPAPEPMLRRGHPRRAEVQRVKSVDIPQWAKDEGHNGSATYVATVAPDGALTDLTLKKSSNSAAIDAAVGERARALRYTPATNGAGDPVEGKVEVYLGYARYDSDSPGGGFDDYTCADMLREYEWFRANSEGFRRIFWPQNAYTSLPSMAMMTTGETSTWQQREKMREAQGKKWDKLVKRCAKTPDQLFLDTVPKGERAFYRTVAEGF